MGILKYKIFRFFDKKKILLLGFARSNKAIADILDECKISFDIADKDKNSVSDEQFKNSKFKLFFGENYLDNILSYDIIFRSPGIKYNEKMKEAKNRNIEFTSEIAFFCQFCKSKNIFAVTGSDGKTTSSNIIYEILKKSGKNVFIGGNIGTPIVSNLFDISENDFVVLELSSFQLFDSKIKPSVAVVTNISENHLDWHSDFDEYLESKINVSRCQDNKDVLILNYDNRFSKYIDKKVSSEVRFFSIKNKIPHGCFIDNENIYFSDGKNEEKIINKNEIKIPGMHNVENFMSAISACFDYVNLDDIRFVCRHFSGVEHRIEFVCEINGVKYFNDSIASSPTRVMKGALSIFTKDVILVAGGYDKKLDFSELADHICKKVKVLILMGQTADKIEDCVLKSGIIMKPKIFKVNSMKEAVLLSYRNSSQNDVVLLSPSCASFGMYKNFEERGSDFKNCVLNLENKI